VSWEIEISTQFCRGIIAPSPIIIYTYLFYMLCWHAISIIFRWLIIDATQYCTPFTSLVLISIMSQILKVICLYIELSIRLVSSDRQQFLAFYVKCIYVYSGKHQYYNTRQVLLEFKVIKTSIKHLLDGEWNIEGLGESKRTMGVRSTIKVTCTLYYKENWLWKQKQFTNDKMYLLLVIAAFLWKLL